MYSSVKLNFSKFDKKMQLLVNEQYTDSIKHGATIKMFNYLLNKFTLGIDS